MLFSERINSFLALAKKIENLSDDQVRKLSMAASNANSWFTERTVKDALSGIAYLLDEYRLRKWADRYDLKTATPRQIGVIAAGNIPLVGFHDILCVLMAGHRLLLKPSSDDEVLMSFLRQELIAIHSYFEESFVMVERLNDADAFIATGSDNSARYFKYYFKDKPHIIRSNRTSVAILTGDETDEQLEQLGQDIFMYYGLGCRNVSKLLAPASYDWTRLLSVLEQYVTIGDHHKYRNNYDYNKSIYLVNKEPFLDNGFLMLRESRDLVSPISVLFYESYDTKDQVKRFITSNADKIQCIVGKDYIPFGQAQFPAVDDYADDVDTMEFLSGLKEVDV